MENVLQEFILASIVSTSSQISNHTAQPIKDVTIFKLPSVANSRNQPQIFKSSSTSSNGLSVSDSHIFAAQSDKATVNVYNIIKGNQESVIPFSEKVTSIINFGDIGEYVALGFESGDLSIWNTASGQIIRANQAHIQPITKICVDPDQNYLLTASKDSTILVWSIPILLAFDPLASLTPTTTFTLHTSSISALATGHSSSNTNFALSLAEDLVAHTWLYSNGKLLHSFNLEYVPRSLVIDPADRSFYVGYDDAKIQMFDLRSKSNKKVIWKTKEPEPGSITCLALNFDATRLLSGHSNGKICSWDINIGQFGHELYTFPSAITNIICLLPEGLAKNSPKIKIQTVIKPKITTTESETTYSNYELCLIPTDVSNYNQDFIPESMIWKAIADQKYTTMSRQATKESKDDDFISFEQGPTLSQGRKEQLLQEQITNLQQSLRSSHTKLKEMRVERDGLLEELKQQRD